MCAHCVDDEVYFCSDGPQKYIDLCDHLFVFVIVAVVAVVVVTLAINTDFSFFLTCSVLSRSRCRVYFELRFVCSCVSLFFASI